MTKKRQISSTSCNQAQQVSFAEKLLSLVFIVWLGLPQAFGFVTLPRLNPGSTFKEKQCHQNHQIHQKPILHTGTDVNKVPQTRTPTSLNGKLWDRLELPPDYEPPATPKWYILNCIAFTELECLYQCRSICSDILSDPTNLDIVEFTVPTQRIVISRGNRRLVEDQVLYPGYVFGKLRLCEEVYERLQGLNSVRGWMGTIRKNHLGYGAKPSIPCPIQDYEVEQFGLEQKTSSSSNNNNDEEEEEEGSSNESNKQDETTTTTLTENEVTESSDGTLLVIDSTDDDGQLEAQRHLADQKLLSPYDGLEIGGMVKITDPQSMHQNEDGIIKRFKNDMVCVRMYTYGSQFDEWFPPSAVRPLTEVEVRKGMGGPDRPIRQAEFNEAMGLPPPIPRGRRGGVGEDRRSNRNLRQNLMGSMGQVRRNRRVDRVSRGDAMKVDSDQQRKKEAQYWEDYKEAQRQRRIRQEKQQQQQGPRGSRRDNRGTSQRAEYDVDRQWGRPTQKLQRQQRSKSPPPPPPRQSSQEERALSDEEDWSSFLGGGNAEDGANSDGDFFDDLLTELSGALDADGDGSASGSSQSSSTSDQERQTTSSSVPVGQWEKNDNDSASSSSSIHGFFEDLQKELESSSPSSSGTTTPTSLNNNNNNNNNNEEEDFFLKLEQEMKGMDNDTIPPPPKRTTTKRPNPARTSKSRRVSKVEATVPTEEEEDFFDMLEAELAKEADDDLSLPSQTSSQVELSSGDSKAKKPNNIKSKQTKSGVAAASASASTTETKGNKEDLSQLTVPMLKERLRSRGLKVSGKKAELIDRLMQ